MAIFLLQSRKDEEMRKRRNITEADDDDITHGAYGAAVTIETLQSLVLVSVGVASLIKSGCRRGRPCH